LADGTREWWVDGVRQHGWRPDIMTAPPST